jgi:nuclear RNA export factor
LYDTNRAALLEAYNDSAMFSFQANTSIPGRARISGYHSKLPNQKLLEWSKYVSGSRNLSRIAGHLEKVSNSIHIGRDAAIAAMQMLPKTIHDLTSAPEKFNIDAWPVNEDNGRITLFLSIHGQFAERASHSLH